MHCYPNMKAWLFMDSFLPWSLDFAKLFELESWEKWAIFLKQKGHKLSYFVKGVSQLDGVWRRNLENLHVPSLPTQAKNIQCHTIWRNWNVSAEQHQYGLVPIMWNVGILLHTLIYDSLVFFFLSLGLQIDIMHFTVWAFLFWCLSHFWW